jgi:hypothetical protein
MYMFLASTVNYNILYKYYINPLLLYNNLQHRNEIKKKGIRRVILEYVRPFHSGSNKYKKGSCTPFWSMKFANRLEIFISSWFNVH